MFPEPADAVDRTGQTYPKVLKYLINERPEYIYTAQAPGRGTKVVQDPVIHDRGIPELDQ